MEAPQHATACQIVIQLARIGVIAAVTYYCAKWLVSTIDPTNLAKKKAKELAKLQLKKINKFANAGKELKLCDFNCHELMIASHLVAPSDIEVCWADIAGLDGVVQELRESVGAAGASSESLQALAAVAATEGSAAAWAPGCGKTLIAKAIARDAGMRFINLDVAVLTDKWYGESQKLAAAVFSLAHKLQPCIIFIDEIESFLRVRTSGDHEATAMMKTQFMMLWDGLVSDASCSVLVLGATNRPQDLDKAILRRMPAQFHIGLPQEQQRLQILNLILMQERLHPLVDLPKLAAMTPGYSGSDLRELCRHASVYRMRSFMRDIINSAEGGKANGECLLLSSELCIGMEDLVKSLVTMNASKLQTGCGVLGKAPDLD